MSVLTFRPTPVVPDPRVRPAPPPRVAARAATSPPVDIVDQWGEHSFPASDPPANW